MCSYCMCYKGNTNCCLTNNLQTSSSGAQPTTSATGPDALFRAAVDAAILVAMDPSPPGAGAAQSGSAQAAAPARFVAAAAEDLGVADERAVRVASSRASETCRLRLEDVRE